MRDMWLEIPGKGTHKFNAAYSYGGISLLYQTIAANFGLKLDGYAVVDFAAFQEVIDSMGGVEIELTQAEYDYLVKAYKNHPEVKDGLTVGKNLMSGAQALAYSRIRQVGRSDYRRTERQRTVIQSMFTKVKGMSLSEIKTLAEQMLPNIVTDLSNEQIYSYMFSVMTMGTTKLYQFRIPTDDAHTPETIDKQKVLVLDLPANVSALNQFIFEEVTEDTQTE
jgi:LCP family protein required for cell wall assembly